MHCFPSSKFGSSLTGVAVGRGYDQVRLPRPLFLDAHHLLGGEGKSCPVFHGESRHCGKCWFLSSPFI